MIKEQNNQQEKLNRIKLMMRYDLSKTLNENKVERLLPKYGGCFFDFNHITNVISEQLNNDLEKLEKTGFKVIEKFVAEPYTMLLLFNGNFYQVALTTNDDEFTSFESQISKPPTHKSNFLKIGKKLVDKLKQWSWLYGTLYVGSFNLSRTEKYKRIFNSLGFNIDKIHYMKANDVYPESYFFPIPTINNKY